MNRLLTEEFNYTLPEHRVPLYPLEERDQSKLLVYQEGEISDLKFFELSSQLNAGDRLVVNNTKVIKARLFFQKKSGRSFELFCLEPANGMDPAIALGERGEVVWNCLVRGSKKWKEEPLQLQIMGDDGSEFTVFAQKEGHTHDGLKVRFKWVADYCFADILALAGAIPIPPYLNRASEKSDELRYQTVYAAFQGSVAAPTAGLHFTPKVLEELKSKGVEVTEITLHVGAGTFRPVKDEVITDHVMHEELILVPIRALEELSNTPGKIIAVGTTSMRTLESLYAMAESIREGHENWNLVGQWDYKSRKNDLSRADALNLILSKLNKQGIESLQGKTGIMIVPGYPFAFCDALITNFHQPKSTLLMLIAAFVGPDWSSVYEYALMNDYRFLSYGDSSLLHRKA